MPQAKPRKTKPVKFTAYTQNYGVKESLVWADPSCKKKSTQVQLLQSERSNFVLPKKGEIGKPTTRGYEPFDHLASSRRPEDDDHVIDALRGWPYSSQTEDQEPSYTDYKYLEDLYGETNIEKEARIRSGGTKKPKKNKAGASKSHRRGNLEESNEPDPHIADLISHRFLSESERKRHEEIQKIEEAARLKAKHDYARKFPKDIKGTKASQLRSIAMSEKVINDPKCLWQMPKFKDNAQPQLDTFRSRSGDKSRTKNSNNNKLGLDGEGNDKENDFYSCTCAEEAGTTGHRYPTYLPEDDNPEPELQFAKAVGFNDEDEVDHDN